MVNIGLVIGAFAVIVALSQLPRIKGLISETFPSGNGNGNGDTTTIEGDTIIIEDTNGKETTVVIIQPDDNTSNGKPTVEDPSSIDDVTKIQEERITALEQALRDERFIAGRTAGTLAATPVSEKEPFAIAPISFAEAQTLEFEDRQDFRTALEESIAQEDKFATSLEGSALVFGEQIKRGTEEFETVLQREKDRAARLAQQLFGSIANPDF